MLSDGVNMAEWLAKWLKEGKERELAELVPNRRYISFPRGVYDVYQDVWMPYGSPRLTPDVVSCRYIGHTMPVDIAFSDEAREQPFSIPTPNFDKILTVQDLPKDVIAWVQVMFGRMLYPLNTRDSWQKIMFIQGKAGNGKSTLANVMRSIYEPTNVGILNSNCEPQWALSGIYDKFIWLCLEVKKNFRLDTGSFQSAISGEPTTINKKYHDPFDVPWDVPGALFGNEFPLCWIDVQGALLRRIMLVNFNKRPTKEEIDPYLMQKIRAELPMLIVKINRMYIAACEACGGDHIDMHLPAYFKETRDKLASQAQPLRALLLNNTLLHKERGRYMMLDEVKEAYNQFCKLNNIPLQRFDEDLYQDVFEELNLECREVTDGIEYGDAIRYGKFVFGIGFAEGAEDASQHRRAAKPPQKQGTKREGYAGRRLPSSPGGSSRTSSIASMQRRNGRLLKRGRPSHDESDDGESEEDNQPAAIDEDQLDGIDSTL